MLKKQAAQEARVPEPEADLPAFAYGPGGSVSGAFGGWASAHQGWLGQQHLEALMKLTGNVSVCVHARVVCVCVWMVCDVQIDQVHALDPHNQPAGSGANSRRVQCSLSGWQAVTMWPCRYMYCNVLQCATHATTDRTACMQPPCDIWQWTHATLVLRVPSSS